MKPTVYSTYYDMPITVQQFIEQSCELKIWSGTGEINRVELLEEIKDAEGLYTSSSSGGPINRTLLEQAKKLKVVSNVSVGYNNFDLEAMKEFGVIGTNTPSVLDDTVADLAMGLVIATGRRIVELDRFMKEKKWEIDTPYSDFYGQDITGKKLGIIGMGRIGEAIAKRAHFGFDMNILYYNRKPKPEAEKNYAATYCSLDDLLSEADYIILMTPLTNETRHLIDEQAFKKMKKSAIFINVSRGETVDEQALIRALKTGEIQAAGLDVYTHEPIEKDNELLTLSNCVTTPHLGSATASTEEAMAMKAAENLVAALTGKPIPNQVI